MTTRGLYVNVLRAARMSDCTNGGVSSRCDEAVLIGEGVAEIFAPDARHPALRLVRRRLGDGTTYLHAEPADRPAGRSVMFGGNFIWSSDSRFRILNEYPIPVHDRVE